MTEKLKVVTAPAHSHPQADALVKQLESKGGNLDLCNFSEVDLFNAEIELAREENKEWRKRWDRALRISAKVRMDSLRCKALKLLEDYKNMSVTSSTSDLAFAKTVLIGVLVNEAEAVKSRWRSAGSTSDNLPPAGIDDLEDEFDRAEGA